LHQNSLPTKAQCEGDPSPCALEFPVITDPSLKFLSGLKETINGFTIEPFESIDELNAQATDSDKQPFCFGIDFATFNTTTHEYDV
jgi:hypothetical protein